VRFTAESIRKINNVIHATYITYMSSEKQAASGLPQLGVRFLADSNSWNVNGMPMLNSTEPTVSDNVLAQST